MQQMERDPGRTDGTVAVWTPWGEQRIPRRSVRIAQSHKPVEEDPARREIPVDAPLN